MRERLDFSAISKTILDNRKIGAMSQVEYYFCLFQYAFNQTNIKLTMPEDAEVSKIISGQRNVAKDIVRALYFSGWNRRYRKVRACEILCKPL